MNKHQRDIERYRSRIDVRGPEECWPWLAGTNENGYGSLRFAGKSELSHRVAFFIEHGRWPEPCGLHSCDNPPCCNPKHLWEGSRTENAADRASKGRNGLRAKKLHPGEAAQARKLRKVYGFTIQSIADAYGLDYAAMWKLLNNKTYRAGVAAWTYSSSHSTRTRAARSGHWLMLRHRA